MWGTFGVDITFIPHGLIEQRPFDVPATLLTYLSLKFLTVRVGYEKIFCVSAKRSLRSLKFIIHEQFPF